MVGTERQANWSLAATGAVGDLLRELDAQGADPAERLLRTLGAMAVFTLAGGRGADAGEAGGEPAAVEQTPALSDPNVLAHVAWSLREGPPRLQHIALTRVAAAGWRLPTLLLPAALDLGRRSVAIRAAVCAVIGERGKWLAGHNSDWRYATGVSDTADDDTTWAHGSAEQRHALMRRQRGTDPVAARERLADELPSLSARERAEMLGTLDVGLGEGDAAYLESLLGDRSKEVRQAALNLLVRLPHCAFAQRASQRVAGLLKHERVLLRTRWTIEAPTSADPAWERDGMEPAKPKQESLGERAWWLYQLARQIPLKWWSTHTAMNAGELLQWATKTDWTEALLRAWRDVLLAAPDIAWCEAFLDGWPWKQLQDDPARLMALLPTAQRERHWQRRLHAGSAGLAATVQQVLAACTPGETVSLQLSRELAAAMRTALADPKIAFDYTLRSSIPDLCCVLHADALDALVASSRDDDATPAQAETQRAVAQVVAALRAFLHPMTAKVPT
jgi:hypothetical protein